MSCRPPHISIHHSPNISDRLTSEDRALEERLCALKAGTSAGGSSSGGSGSVAASRGAPLTDDEMMNKVHEIRGVPPPRPAPPGGWLPPKALTAEEAEALLQQATDAVRLEGGDEEMWARSAAADARHQVDAALAASRGGRCGGRQRQRKRAA